MDDLLDKKLASEFTDASDTLDELINSISHDVLSQVRRVNNFSQLLKDETNGLSPRGETYLAAIMDNCTTLNQSLNAIIEYSKVRKAKHTFNTFALVPVIKQVQNKLKKIYPYNKIVLQVTNVNSFYGSRKLITSLLTHILDNAIKFNKSRVGIEIEIAGQDSKENILLSVTDNGIGIDKVNIASLFKPFYRLHTSNEYTGIGMGLTIAKAITEKHKGNIKITSKLNQGTTVNLTFPKL